MCKSEKIHSNKEREKDYISTMNVIREISSLWGEIWSLFRIEACREIDNARRWKFTKKIDIQRNNMAEGYWRSLHVDDRLAIEEISILRFKGERKDSIQFMMWCTFIPINTKLTSLLGFHYIYLLFIVNKRKRWPTII